MNRINFASQIIGERRYQSLILFGIRERTFLRLIAFFLVIAIVFYPYPQIAMWIGFMFAGYSAIANDSIQTIGTFIASNQNRKWWELWLYIGIIFVVTVWYSWYNYNGDVSFQRLTSKGFEESPTSFKFLQLAAPIILLFITRLRMPVSTTFMLLSAFSADTKAIIKVGQKSMTGYFIAFATAMVVWYLASALIKRLTKGEPHRLWIVAQWVISGILWSVWIQQDAANIAIFLNRSLSFYDFLFFTGFIFFGLGLLFYFRGDKIQEIITEKSSVTDVRSASVIDLVYAFILWYFQSVSTIPMSTTWVFLGLLAGRELSMTLSKNYDGTRSLSQTIKMIFKDLSFALLGLSISILLAIAINPNIQRDIANMLGW